MPLTIKDYYNSNDYNGLFSWLLYNIRHGEFEELNNNLLKRELLRRFIIHYFTTGNEMVLLVSIPDNIISEQNNGADKKNSSIGGGDNFMNKHYFLQQNQKQKSFDFKILENFLKDYFHLDSLKNISIKKLVTYIEDESKLKNTNKNRSKNKKSSVNIINNCVVYNHEIHYLISDPIDGFRNEEWLKLRKSLSEDLENKKTRTISTTNGKESLSESMLSHNSNPSDVLEIDFRHHDDQNKENETNCNNNNNINNNTQVNGKQTLVNKEYIHSINSYAYSTDDSFGTQLEPVETRDGDNGEQGERENIDDDFNESMLDDSSLDDLSSFDDDEEEDEDDDDDMASILPSISIRDNNTDLQFRLVLQSIIIIKASPNGSSFKMNTAIRQSNYLPYVATIDDDWLLYDDTFDIENLQICTLNDIWVMNKKAEKILFYSLVDISMVKEEEEEAEEEHNRAMMEEQEEEEDVREREKEAVDDSEEESELIEDIHKDFDDNNNNNNNNHEDDEEEEDEEIEDLQSYDSHEIRPLSIQNNVDNVADWPPQQLFNKSDESEHGIQLYAANTNVTNPLQLKTTITNGTFAGAADGHNGLRKHLTLSSYNKVERSQTISQNGLLKESPALSSLKKITTSSSNKNNKNYLKMIKGNRKAKKKEDIDDKNCAVM
ncbi:hypothetical protein ACO0SA_003945 [Hanseniaspora valbyensis]